MWWPVLNLHPKAAVGAIVFKLLFLTFECSMFRGTLLLLSFSFWHKLEANPFAK